MACTSTPPSFTSLRGVSLGSTLIRKLVPTVDKLRDLATKFGIRPYEVHVIRTRWSGGERGVGEEYIVQDVMILPTPKVSDLTGLNIQIESIGSIEAGSLRITQISMAYTEDQLSGKDSNGNPPGDEEQVYYEIYIPGSDGTLANGVRRRFTIISAPTLKAGSVQWQVMLGRTAGDRDRAGGPT
jgi:hypothetical protein